MKSDLISIHSKEISSDYPSGEYASKEAGKILHNGNSFLNKFLSLGSNHDVTLKAKESEGFIFAGWYENGQVISYDKENTFNFSGDNARKIEARFYEKVEITFRNINPNGDWFIWATRNVPYGMNFSEFNLEIPSDAFNYYYEENEIFDDWYYRWYRVDKFDVTKTFYEDSVVFANFTSSKNNEEKEQYNNKHNMDITYNPMHINENNPITISIDSRFRIKDQQIIKNSIEYIDNNVKGLTFIIKIEDPESKNRHDPIFYNREENIINIFFDDTGLEFTGVREGGGGGLVLGTAQSIGDDNPSRLRNLVKRGEDIDLLGLEGQIAGVIYITEYIENLDMIPNMNKDNYEERLTMLIQHEFLHILGFKHVPNAPDLMYGSFTNSGPFKEIHSAQLNARFPDKFKID